jgi:hypothetical protein
MTDNELPPKPQQSNETISPKADPIDTYIPGEISRILDGEPEVSEIEKVLDPIPEPTLETMLRLHSSTNPEMQLEYVERLARMEPAERQQVEEYVEKRRSDIWPPTEERLKQLYAMSRADTNAPVEAFAEELRAMTPDQRNQFTQYRNERITEEAKGMAESSVAGTQTQATQSQAHDSMPGENATATTEAMRQQAQAMPMKDSPKPKWWKIWRRK